MTGQRFDERKITLREAIEMYPGLLDELVTWGSLNGKSFHNAKSVTFQFCGDGNYRTNDIKRTDGLTKETIIRVLRAAELTGHFKWPEMNRPEASVADDVLTSYGDAPTLDDEPID